MRSVRNKYHCIENVLNLEESDILCMTETWLRKDDVLPNVNSYNIFRSDREERGGGVAMLCRSTLTVKEIRFGDNFLKRPTSLEILALSIQVRKNKSFNVISIYRTGQINNDLKNIDKIFEFFSQIDKQCFILGDFNINVMDETGVGKRLLSIAERHNFVQTVKNPTRGNNIIDLIFVKVTKENAHTTTVIDRDVSDHLCTNIIISVKKFKKESRELVMKDYRNAKWEDIIKQFTEIQPKKVLLGIDNLCDEICTSVNRAYELVPTKSIRINEKRVNVVPSAKTQRMIAIRRYHIAKLKLTNFSWHRQKIKFYDKLIKQNNKEDFKEDFQAKIREKGFWGVINRNMKIDFKKSSKPLNSVDPNTINDYYCEMGFPPGAEIVNTINSTVQTNSLDNGFKVSTVNQSNMFLAWRKIRKKLSKKCDTTGICKFFMDKIFMLPAVNEMVLNFINRSFEFGIVPDKLKIARVVPIPKIDGAVLPADFRPVSIISNLLMLLEKVYYDKLVVFLQENCILSKSQFGCRKGHSPELAMIASTDFVLKKIDKGYFAVLVSIDLRKAFDSVHKEKLLEKLKVKYGISDFWLRSCLSQRKQFVELNGRCSKIRDVLIGVPAGSILGGILFALYINDLPTVVVNGFTVMFVDDSNFIFFARYDQIELLQNQITTDMNHVCEYLSTNSLVINADKTKMITLSSSRKASLLDNLYFQINGFDVKGSSSLKCLGFNLDRNLTWKDHIGKVSKICFLRIRALYTIKSYLTGEQVKLISQAYVLSVCNYMISIYGSANNKHLFLIKRVVRSLARLVLGLRKYDKVSQKLYEDLEWLLPWDMCAYKTLCNLFILHKNRDVELFNDCFKKCISERRKNDFVCLVRPTKEVGKKVFEFRAVSLWNRLPNDIKEIETVILFKIRVKAWLIKNCLNKLL